MAAPPALDTAVSEGGASELQTPAATTAAGFRPNVFLHGAEHPHLSWEVMLDYRDRTHPRKVRLLHGKADYARLSVCGMNVGAHKICPKVCGSKKDQGELSTFGIGVMLFFKLIKFVVVLNLLLSILVAPALVLYAIGDTDWITAGSSLDATQLWRFTPANMGSSATLCASALERDAGATVSLQCPDGTVISRIEAYYGLNAGECTCPKAMSPLSSSTCPGGRDSSGLSCIEDRPCFYSPDRELMLPSGVEIHTGACCSSDLLEGAADFTALNGAVDDECNARNTQRLAEALCLRKESCMIHADRSRLQAWVQDASVRSRTCNSSELAMGQLVSNQFPSDVPSDAGDSSVVCASYLDAAGGLAQCATPTDDAVLDSYTYASLLATANGSSNAVRLLVSAQCSALYIRVPGYFTIGKDTAAMVIMSFDIILIIAFLLAVSVLAKREKQQQTAVQFATPADYTIVIRDLPPHSSTTELEESIRKHLESYLARVPHVVKDNSMLKYGCEVADINFGLDSSDLTGLKVGHGECANELQRLVAEMTVRGLTWASIKAHPDYRLLMDHGGGWRVRCFGGACLTCFGTEELRMAVKITEAIDELRMAHKRVQVRMKDDQTVHAVTAFVTFVEEEAVFRAKAEFPNSTCYAQCCSPRLARMPYRDPKSGREAVWPLKVSRADEPSDIIWENVRFTKGCKGRTRRLLGDFATLVLLVGAFLAIYFLERWKILTQREYPKIDCKQFMDPGNKEAAARDERFQQFDQITGRTGRIQCYCTSLLSNSSGNPFVLTEEPFPIPDNLYALERFGDDVMQSPVGLTVKGSYGTSVALDQYPLPPGWRYEFLCGLWLSSYSQIQALTYGTAVLALLLKSSVASLIRIAVKIERLASLSEQTLSRARKMVVANFVITCILVVIINARINEGVLDQILIGNHADFDADWYKGPGTSIMLTMMLNIIFDSFGFCRRVWRRKILRFYDRGWSIRNNFTTRVATQMELNELYSGIKMPLDELYASIINMVLVSMTFAVGMPLLLPIACVFSFVFFWTQKILFVRFYRSPPALESVLAKKMTSVLPIAIIFNAFLGSWMLSNPEVFPSTATVENLVSDQGTGNDQVDSVADSINETGTAALQLLRQLTFSGYNIGERIAKPHVLPLFVTGLLFLVWGILRLTIGKVVNRACVGLLNTCRCCCGCLLPSEDAGFENLRSYWDALPDAILNDFPFQYKPKPALVTQYAAAKRRRRNSLNAEAVAKRRVDRVRRDLAAAQDKATRLAAHSEELQKRTKALQAAAAEGNAEAASALRECAAAEHDVRSELEVVIGQLRELEKESQRANHAARSAAARAGVAGRLSTIMLEAMGSDQAGIAAAQADVASRVAAEASLSTSNANKVMSSSVTHSYAMDDNVEYRKRFGFDAVRSLADPDLLADIKAYMPQAHGTSGSSSKQVVSAEEARDASAAHGGGAATASAAGVSTSRSHQREDVDDEDGDETDRDEEDDRRQASSDAAPGRSRSSAESSAASREDHRGVTASSTAESSMADPAMVMPAAQVSVDMSQVAEADDEYRAGDATGGPMQGAMPMTIMSPYHAMGMASSPHAMVASPFAYSPHAGVSYHMQMPMHGVVLQGPSAGTMTFVQGPGGTLMPASVMMTSPHRSPAASRPRTPTARSPAPSRPPTATS